MADAQQWTNALRTRAGGVLVSVQGLVALRDQYTALGEDAWITESGGIPEGSGFSAADIDAVMDWLPYVLEGMTQEIRAALYRLAPPSAQAGGGTVGPMGPLP